MWWHLLEDALIDWLIELIDVDSGRDINLNWFKFKIQLLTKADIKMVNTTSKNASEIIYD